MERTDTKKKMISQEIFKEIYSGNRLKDLFNVENIN